MIRFIISSVYHLFYIPYSRSSSLFFRHVHRHFPLIERQASADEKDRDEDEKDGDILLRKVLLPRWPGDRGQVQFALPGRAQGRLAHQT